MKRVRWIAATTEMFGVAVAGIGGAGTIGHLFHIQSLYNWNGAPDAMGFADAIAITLIGIVLVLLGDAVERLAKAVGTD